MNSYADPSFWTPVAPDVGNAWAMVPPAGAPNDGLGMARGTQVQTERVHAKSNGYLPKWSWVAPPGIGDAPQHVWQTYFLAPLDVVKGPGDMPATYFRDWQPPTFANFAMRWQGMAVDGGNLLMTGLYTPQPLESLSNDIFAGSS